FRSPIAVSSLKLTPDPFAAQHGPARPRDASAKLGATIRFGQRELPLSADVERGRSGLGRRWGVRSADRGDHDSPTSSLGHEAIRQPARTRRWSITTTRTHLVVGYKKPPHNGGGVAGLLRSSCGHLVRR